MQQREFSRREFLRASTVVTASTVGGAIIFGPNNSWAQATGGFDPHAARTLLMMAYDIFPHQMLGMKYYAKVVNDLDKDATANPANRKMLLDGIAMLDAATGIKWIDLSDGGREAILKKNEKTPFFAAVRSQTITSLHGNPLVYHMFNYGGSSMEYGGYLDRGFDDIGWLPKQ